MKRAWMSFLGLAVAALLGCGGDGSGSTTSGSSTTSTTSGTGGSGTGGSSTTGTGGGTGGSPDLGPCAAGGAEVTALPACTAAASAKVEASAGCEPTVDGTLHDAEWSDSACFDAGPGDMTVDIKHAGGFVYLATSGVPTCGCGMQFYFLAADGTNFVILVFDDPFGKDGDRGDFTLSAASDLTMTAVDKSVTVACPGDQPNPVRYEWKIPLAKLGLEAGKAGQFKLAIVHAGAHWPAGLALGPSGIATYAADEPTWGTVSAASW